MLILAFAITFAILSVAVFAATRPRVAGVDVRLRWPDVAIRVVVGVALLTLAALAVGIWFAFSA
ncbi:hypothetical protein GCM10025773_33790 [Microbacterium jejuense]